VKQDTWSTIDVSDDSLDLSSTGFSEIDEFVFHPMYLQEEAADFVTPIHFEDGMDWDECERYYTLISEGNMEAKSFFHMKRSPQLRKPAKRELQQEVNGELVSCLRMTSGSRRKPRPRPQLRRNVSFHTLPMVNSAYSHYYGCAMREGAEGPRVSFDDYVAVTTIYAVDDYTEEDRSGLWMSKLEMQRSIRGAMREQAMIRRAREREAEVRATHVMMHHDREEDIVSLLQALSDDEEEPSEPPPAITALPESPAAIYSV